MSEPNPSPPRDLCPRCLRAASHCWCARLTARPSRVRLVILQHPREARHKLNTARMARLGVAGAELAVGVDFGANPVLERALADPNAVLLYPSPDARDVRELAAIPGPFTAVVIDGTWSQARKIYKSNPGLSRLPAYRFDPARPSRYDGVRKEPAAHCVSTVEAIAVLLEAAEERPGAFEGLIEPLEQLVRGQKAFSSTKAERAPRRRLRKRPGSGVRLPEALEGVLDRALLVVGEGNGWPMETPNRPKPELVQWLAIRPATGECFEQLVRPPGPLSPTCPGNLGLAEAEILAAPGAAELRERWNAFVRPDDVWCFWGFHSLRLISEAGAVSPSKWVDVRRSCHARLRARTLDLTDAHAKLRAPELEPLGRGRGGSRLARLQAVCSVLFGTATLRRSA